MATTVTHATFVSDAMKKLNKDFNKKDKLILTTTAQSVDSFYFYKFYSFTKKNKRIRHLAKRVHNTHTNEFFITMIDYIKNNNLGNNSSVIAALYGLLSHYVLDSTIHPYVVHYSGKFSKKDKSTWKNNAKHTKIETALDKYIIKNNLNGNPRNYKLYKYIDFHLTNELKNTLDYSFKKVFKFNNFSKYYQKSIQDMKFVLHYGRYDPLGIALFFYKFAFKIKKNMKDPRPISYKYKVEEDYFNLKKDVWTFPTDKNIKSNKTLLELYDDAFKSYLNLIKRIDEHLYQNKKVNLNKELQDLSYATGVDWKLKEKVRYFN